MATTALDRRGALLVAGWMLALGLKAPGVLALGLWRPEDAFHGWALLAAPLAITSAVYTRARGGAWGWWLAPAPLWAALVYLARPPYAGASTSRLSLTTMGVHLTGIALMYLLPVLGTVAAAVALGRAARRGRASGRRAEPIGRGVEAGKGAGELRSST